MYLDKTLPLVLQLGSVFIQAWWWPLCREFTPTPWQNRHCQQRPEHAIVFLSIRSLSKAETNVIKIKLCRLLRIQNSFTDLSSRQVYNTHLFTTSSYKSEGPATPSGKTMVAVLENGKTHNASTPNVGFTIKSCVAYDGSLYVKQSD